MFLTATFCLLLLVFVTGKTVTPGTFSCFREDCIRGVQYCIENEGICADCNQVDKKCGTADMPRDCDGYCIRKEADNIRNSLNQTLTEKQELEAEVDRLRVQLYQTTQTDRHPETHNLEISLKQLNVSFTNCTREKRNYLEQANTAQISLAGCQRSKERWFVSNAVLGIVIAIVMVVIVYLLLVRHKQSPDEPRDEEYAQENESDPLNPEPDNRAERSDDKGLADSGVSLEDVSEGASVHGAKQKPGATREISTVDARNDTTNTTHIELSQM